MKMGVRIPNKELMEKFDEMLQKEESLGYIYRLAKESVQMLKATLANDINGKDLSYVQRNKFFYNQKRNYQ